MRVRAAQSSLESQLGEVPDLLGCRHFRPAAPSALVSSLWEPMFVSPRGPMAACKSRQQPSVARFVQEQPELSSAWLTQLFSSCVSSSCLATFPSPRTTADKHCTLYFPGSRAKVSSESNSFTFPLEPFRPPIFAPYNYRPGPYGYTTQINIVNYYAADPPHHCFQEQPCLPAASPRSGALRGR